jgi:hypothetical protein
MRRIALNNTSGIATNNRQMVAYTLKISPAELTLFGNILRRFSPIVFKDSLENLDIS